MRIAAFPKCYIEDLSSGRMALQEWIRLATTLGVDGLELYERFLQSTDPAYLDTVGEWLSDAGFAMPMLCCSPDLVHPDPSARRAAIDGEAAMMRVTRHLGGPGAACRILSGQRHPGVDVDQGVQWVLDAVDELLPLARELDVVLAMENHYEDGFWQYPEFVQRPEVFHRIVDAVDDRQHFGVQFDPSNALVAGVDPVDFLRSVAPRLVTMQASDRYLEPGHTSDELVTADGTLGYSPHLQHGEVGQGLNDYDAIFAVLRDAGYDGWISIEDGLDGMTQMAASVAFLRRMVQAHPPRAHVNADQQDPVAGPGHQARSPR